MTRREHRGWIVVPGVLGLVVVLMLGTISAGLRLPGLSQLVGLPGFGTLDSRVHACDESIRLDCLQLAHRAARELLLGLGAYTTDGTPPTEKVTSE